MPHYDIPLVKTFRLNGHQFAKTAAEAVAVINCSNLANAAVGKLVGRLRFTYSFYENYL